MNAVLTSLVNFSFVLCLCLINDEGSKKVQNLCGLDVEVALNSVPILY